MATQTIIRDREPELLAVGPVTLAGKEFKSRKAQPSNGKIFERVTDIEDA